MRGLFYVLSAMAVMGLAYWAYQENYRTQAVLGDVRSLEAEIGRLRETLGVMRAEWAYLNRPDRLLELVEINYGTLGLLPLDPAQFGDVEQISFPPLPMPVFELSPIMNTVDLMGVLPTLTGERQ
ncbi:MAG: hypothetical protein ACI9IV_002463 [Paracoccaceae bacterium]|jgi:hypothetical protein|tara:strand:+ start:195 stop:569 length:375 start_codon:yes stop_codon:yes gene_type:complete